MANIPFHAHISITLIKCKVEGLPLPTEFAKVSCHCISLSTSCITSYIIKLSMQAHCCITLWINNQSQIFCSCEKMIRCTLVSRIHSKHLGPSQDGHFPLCTQVQYMINFQSNVFQDGKHTCWRYHLSYKDTETSRLYSPIQHTFGPYFPTRRIVLHLGHVPASLQTIHSPFP